MKLQNLSNLNSPALVFVLALAAVGTVLLAPPALASCEACELGTGGWSCDREAAEGGTSCSNPSSTQCSMSGICRVKTDDPVQSGGESSLAVEVRLGGETVLSIARFSPGLAAALMMVNQAESALGPWQVHQLHMGWTYADVAAVVQGEASLETWMEGRVPVAEGVEVHRVEMRFDEARKEFVLEVWPQFTGVKRVDQPTLVIPLEFGMTEDTFEPIMTTDEWFLRRPETLTGPGEAAGELFR